MIVEDHPDDELVYEVFARELVAEGKPTTQWKSIDFIEWLQFSQKEGKLTGNPTKDTVFSAFTIKIIVNDGYKSTEQEFTIHVVPTA